MPTAALTSGRFLFRPAAEGVSWSQYQEALVHRYLIAAVAVPMLFAALPAVTAAPQTTSYPGQMTEARVWVQNRGRSDAVAVDLRDVNLDHALRVHIANGEGTDPGGVPLQTRAARQTWEYDSLIVSGAG